MLDDELRWCVEVNKVGATDELIMASNRRMFVPLELCPPSAMTIRLAPGWRDATLEPCESGASKCRGGD
jgi:hypothetical protein